MIDPDLKPRTLAGRGSLQFKLLVPLLLVGLVLATLALSIMSRRDETRMRDQLQARADAIVHAVKHAADSIPDKDSLGRFVSGIGAAPDVQLIVVTSGGPGVVVASTKALVRYRRTRRD